MSKDLAFLAKYFEFSGHISNFLFDTVSHGVEQKYSVRHRQSWCQTEIFLFHKLTNSFSLAEEISRE